MALRETHIIIDTPEGARKLAELKLCACCRFFRFDEARGLPVCTRHDCDALHGRPVDTQDD